MEKEYIPEKPNILSKVPNSLEKLDPFFNVYQGLVGNNRNILVNYWQNAIREIEKGKHDFKVHQIPLSRIKKLIKTDKDVKMISTEVPILFAKGCDIFITELTLRAWIHAKEDKRRTLQKSDIINAISKSDMFDFLLDIISKDIKNCPKNTEIPIDTLKLDFTPKIQIPATNDIDKTCCQSCCYGSNSPLNIDGKIHKLQHQMDILKQSSYIGHDYNSYSFDIVKSFNINMTNSSLNILKHEKT
ncbi:hypothetical protein PORY_001924 [Pneumocystis oryctolagi]|uniref:Uncharacterized protein n=1 Tax=Pneumocystis oryctolagi TaxID=42067 RepID=A0ACB7C9Y5_9ASCO|nr:hypothetical protein PORY_001924 [Pneumocystis oryctolagi]